LPGNGGFADAGAGSTAMEANLSIAIFSQMIAQYKTFG
jgi:hypothetical protein